MAPTPSQTVANIMDASGVNTCVAFDEHTPSSAVLELFAQGTHRCPVLSSEELTGVLSQVCLTTNQPTNHCAAHHSLSLV